MLTNSPDVLANMANHSAWLLLGAAVVGVILGSFYTVVIARLPTMLNREWEQQLDQLAGPADTAPLVTDQSSHYNLLVPRSHCSHCRQTIAAKDNIPLFSFLLLCGRCRHCRQPIHWRYPLIEVTSALLAVAVVWEFGASWQALVAVALVGISLILLAIDSEHLLLPDTLTLGLMWLGLLANLAERFTPLTDAVVGAAVGYSALWLLFWLVRLATGRDAMGYGDFKYLAAIGAWFGVEGVLLGLLIASTLGSLVGISARLAGRLERFGQIPFGPFLAVAAVVLLFAQPTLSHWLWGGLGG